MKPWARNRASRRWATRCSRCRWTVSSLSTPASSKTTGRIGASRRQSASFWSALRGGRSVSRVAAQVGSAPVRRSSAGKVQVAFPWSPPLPSALRASGSAPSSSSAQDNVWRNGAASNPTQFRDRSSKPRQRSTCAVRSSRRSRAASSSLLGDPPANRIEIRRLDLAFQPVCVPVADAATQPPLHVVRRSPSTGCRAPA